MWCNEYNFNYVRREVDTSDGKSPVQLKDRENGSKVGTFWMVVTQHMSQTCRISVSIETLEISNCAWIIKNGQKTPILLVWSGCCPVFPLVTLAGWKIPSSPRAKKCVPLVSDYLVLIRWRLLAAGGGRGSSSVQQLQHPPSVPHQMQVLTIVWIVRNFEVERQCVVVNLVQ